MSDQLLQWTLTFVIISMIVCPIINLVGGDEKAIGCMLPFLTAILLVIVLFVGCIIVEVSKNSPVASGLLIAVLAAIGLFHWFMAITSCGAKRDSDKRREQLPTASKDGTSSGRIYSESQRNFSSCPNCHSVDPGTTVWKCSRGHVFCSTCMGGHYDHGYDTFLAQCPGCASIGVQQSKESSIGEIAG